MPPKHSKNSKVVINLHEDPRSLAVASLPRLPYRMTAITLETSQVVPGVRRVGLPLTLKP